MYILVTKSQEPGFLPPWIRSRNRRRLKKIQGVGAGASPNKYANYNNNILGVICRYGSRVGGGVSDSDTVQGRTSHC